MNKTENGCLVVILGIILAIALIFAYAGIALWLWSVIAVGVFALPALTYWEIMGLYCLIRILFGNHSGVTNIYKEYIK